MEFKYIKMIRELLADGENSYKMEKKKPCFWRPGLAVLLCHMELRDDHKQMCIIIVLSFWWWHSSTGENKTVLYEGNCSLTFSYSSVKCHTEIERKKGKCR